MSHKNCVKISFTLLVSVCFLKKKKKNKELQIFFFSYNKLAFSGGISKKGWVDMVLCFLRQSTWQNPIKLVHLREIQLSTTAKFVGFVKINISMVMANIYGEMTDGRKCGLLSKSIRSLPQVGSSVVQIFPNQFYSNC